MAATTASHASVMCCGAYPSVTRVEPAGTSTDWKISPEAEIAAADPFHRADQPGSFNSSRTSVLG